MIWQIVFILCLRPVYALEIQRCLTGYMTDVQSWVDEDGTLIMTEDTVDLSTKLNVEAMLQLQMMEFRSPKDNGRIKYLSMARCNLSRVPFVFQFKDTNNRYLSDTVEYLSLYGNKFSDIGTPGNHYDMSMNATSAKEVVLGYGREVVATWSAGFQEVTFPHLRELDLRNCSIQILSGDTFRGMQSLESLYLGENRIVYIHANAFRGLGNLLHLDLSRNFLSEEVKEEILMIESLDLFKGLNKLVSLDLSYTKLGPGYSRILQSLRKRCQILSICYTGINRLGDAFFNRTSISYLDVSGNPGIFNIDTSLVGLENKLKVLYASSTMFSELEILKNFNRLEILKLSNNKLTNIPSEAIGTLTSLKALYLDKNRLTSWFQPTFSLLPNLYLLNLRYNNINIVSNDMLNDLENVSYVGMGDNFMVCNCHNREFYEIALKNEIRRPDDSFEAPTEFSGRFHTGFIDIENTVASRKNISRFCSRDETCNFNIELEVDGKYLLLDYQKKAYECLTLATGKTIPFAYVPLCSQNKRDINYEQVIERSWNKLLALLVIPIFIVPLALFLYVFRRNLRYFCITVKNSAMLSLINRNDVFDDATIFNYDVFVSYCNEDRSWVLEELLPHVERDCNVSVCLHERDFQVGLSILENIVSCMDRSRSIMLIISQRFLLSQWCQFEMHLAQHRLLETRREDLILILLEDIPRRLRPNTLHYLMVTKTYILWPKEENERAMFWRRLHKSILTHQLKRIETNNISLA